MKDKRKESALEALKTEKGSGLASKLKFVAASAVAMFFLIIVARMGLRSSEVVEQVAQLAATTSGVVEQAAQFTATADATMVEEL